MDIALLKTWNRNIGNVFIDKGTKAFLENTLDADITEISGYPNISAHRRELGEATIIPKSLGGDRIRKKLHERRDISDRMVNISDFLDPDLAVIPGCILTKFALEPYFKTLKKLSDSGTDIVFLGVGGGNYSQETQNYVSDVLKKIEPIGLFSRDTETYQLYKDYAEYAYNGIDSAFFIDEWYKPPKSTKKFQVFTFDKMEEPNLPQEELTIRPNHLPFGDSKPFEGSLMTAYKKVENRVQYKKDNIFVSDSAKDYLFLYANTEETHSDRIHACVPTIVYGNAAKFYFDTPRAGLFDNMLSDNEIMERKVSLPRSRLENKKESQREAFRDMLSANDLV